MSTDGNVDKTKGKHKVRPCRIIIELIYRLNRRDPGSEAHPNRIVNHFQDRGRTGVINSPSDFSHVKFTVFV